MNSYNLLFLTSANKIHCSSEIYSKQIIKFKLYIILGGLNSVEL